jgi:hypothetical protein
MQTLVKGAALLGLGLVALGAIEKAMSAPNCKKGIPCGNTCIAASRTCRIGAAPAAGPVQDDVPNPASVSRAARTVPLNAAPAPAAAGVAIELISEPDDADWVGSIADAVYFRKSCHAARDLAITNRRLFASEQEARTLGFRRSSVPEC